MSGSQRVLIYSGLALLIIAMSYGLWYAVFAEHQRLDQIGGSLASSFASAAAGDAQASHSALRTYGEAKYLYTREVDVHSHWGGLAILLILFGAVFDRTRFSEHIRLWLAISLSTGSFAFPLSVLLQNFDHGQWPRVLAAVTSGILMVSMTMVAAGFIRHSDT